VRTLPLGSHPDSRIYVLRSGKNGQRLHLGVQEWFVWGHGAGHVALLLFDKETIDLYRSRSIDRAQSGEAGVTATG
jgi:hypothetical protein